MRVSSSSHPRYNRLRWLRPDSDLGSSRSLAVPVVRMLPDLSSARAEIAAGRRRLAQLLRPRDTPEPVGAWRSAPEAALRSLRLDEKRSYLAAILPVARTARIVERRHLRRLYQLFTFMEIPDELRIELVCALHMNARLSPESLPVFADRSVSRSLLVEVVAMTGKSPSKEAR